MTVRPTDFSGGGADAAAGDAVSLAPSDRRVKLFEHLTPAARDDFLAAATTRRFRAGERLYTQDSHHRVMYRVVSGHLWLSYVRADGREHLCTLLGPGECFGISTLIDGEGLPQNATARTDVTVQVVDQSALARLREAHRSVDDALMRSVIRDVRVLIARSWEPSLVELPQRLARRLLALAAPGPVGTTTVSLTQTELAGTLGVSRQTLNKVLNQFEADGLVRRSYGGVQLLDLDAIRALAEVA